VFSVIVLKIGGARGIVPSALAEDVALHVHRGQQLVLCHGGSAETTELAHALGHPPKFLTSASGHQSRYTDRETLEIFMMAVAGKINKTVVEALQTAGVNAVGLSGLDGRLVEASRKKAIKAIVDGKTKVIRDDWSGKIERVNTSLLNLLVDQGYTPVISPVVSGRQGEALNVDADRVAAAIAVSMRAERLVLLSNVSGLLQDVNEPESLIRSIPRHALYEYMQYARGRMKKKMLAAEEALAGGMREVIISDARSASPLSAALERKGTVIG